MVSVVLPLVAAGITAPVKLRIGCAGRVLVKAQEHDFVGAALGAARDVFHRFRSFVCRVGWKSTRQHREGTAAVNVSDFYIHSPIEAAVEVFNIFHIRRSNKC